MLTRTHPIESNTRSVTNVALTGDAWSRLLGPYAVSSPIRNGRRQSMIQAAGVRRAGAAAREVCVLLDSDYV